MEKRTPRPRDANQLAKLIVDIAAGEEPDTIDDGKDPAAVSLGRRGGLRGGRARAEKLTADEKSEIASRASKARWESTEK